MPKVINTRNHVQVFGPVRLEKGETEVTDEQLKTLQESETFRKASARGWVGVPPRSSADADKGHEVTPGKPQGPRPQGETHPAQPDGSPVEPGTKPELAPMDFPEAGNRASKTPSRK